MVDLIPTLTLSPGSSSSKVRNLLLVCKWLIKETYSIGLFYKAIRPYNPLNLIWHTSITYHSSRQVGWVGVSSIHLKWYRIGLGCLIICFQIASAHNSLKILSSNPYRLLKLLGPMLKQLKFKITYRRLYICVYQLFEAEF